MAMLLGTHPAAASLARAEEEEEVSAVPLLRPGDVRAAPAALLGALPHFGGIWYFG